jgi:hypothetical protein
MNYLILLIGFKDLACRAAIERLKKHAPYAADATLPATVREILNRFHASKLDLSSLERNLTDVSTVLSELMGPLQLKSELQGDHIEVDVNEIAAEILENGPFLSRFLMRSAGSLLILSHEISKDQPWHDVGPLWEFLRHCRNAAAHGGRFRIDAHRGEPRHPAFWGRFRIDAALQDTPLFKDEAHPGFLSPGDPIRLLWDIEQAYPSMRA